MKGKKRRLKSGGHPICSQGGHVPPSYLTSLARKEEESHGQKSQHRHMKKASFQKSQLAKDADAALKGAHFCALATYGLFSHSSRGPTSGEPCEQTEAWGACFPGRSPRRPAPPGPLLCHTLSLGFSGIFQGRTASSFLIQCGTLPWFHLCSLFNYGVFFFFFTISSSPTSAFPRYYSNFPIASFLVYLEDKSLPTWGFIAPVQPTPVLGLMSLWHSDTNQLVLMIPFCWPGALTSLPTRN